MSRSFILAVVLLASSLGTSSTASASILPCTGKSLVKVVDMYYPKGVEDHHISQLREQRIHLGYQFKGCFGGEWVGFVAQNQPPVPLSDQQLRAMLFVSGMNNLPSVPSYWSSPENYRIGVMWLILGLVVIIAATLQQMGVMTGRSDANGSPEATADGSDTPASVPTAYQSALVAIERAAAETGRIVIAGPVQPPRSVVRHHTPVPRFGKR